MALDQVDVDVAESVKEEKEMSFFEHLEALRWHIIRALAGIFAVALLLFFQKDFIFKTVVFGPRNPDFYTYRLFCSFGEMMCIQPTHFDVITRDLAEKFTTHLTVSIILGLIVAFPYVFWEFWRFVRPGLYPSERKSARGIVLVCSLLFLMGVLFGYYFIAPFALSFLAGYELADTLATPTLNSYINYMIMFTLPVGVVFEMPVVSFFLTKAGLLSPQVMRKGRRYAVIIILIVAAILTPSPDVVSQLILATPLYILYEMSIAVSGNVWRGQQKKVLAEEAELAAREKALMDRNQVVE